MKLISPFELNTRVEIWSFSSGTPVRISIRVMRRSKTAFPGKHRRLLTEEVYLASQMRTPRMHVGVRKRILP